MKQQKYHDQQEAENKDNTPDGNTCMEGNGDSHGDNFRANMSSENDTYEDTADGMAGGLDKGENEGAGCVAENENGESMEQADWKDKYLRLSAEFDNYRKRTLKEKMELVAMGGEDIVKQLLPVLDDMDRALSSMDKTHDFASAKKGMELIAGKFKDILGNKGLAEIESAGLPLDTDLHEAVAKCPVGKERKGLIADVVEKGYKLKDKVIRHSKVVVGE